MQNVFKSVAVSRDLAVRLKNRIKSVIVVESIDAQRFPTQKVSIGAKSVFIRISTDSARSLEDGHVDGLGLPQTVYSPHKVELLQEVALTADATTAALRVQVISECAKLGMKLIVLEGTNVEDAADYAAAAVLATTVAATIKSDDINPLTAQM